mmetsp:Transcript_18145/g.50500  ORF Transcript_18145/g.50500 Transcript_18145/m.50500 type:complete len:93 (-) Transcript_18145:1342-1620(-)
MPRTPPPPMLPLRNKPPNPPPPVGSCRRMRQSLAVPRNPNEQVLRVNIPTHDHSSCNPKHRSEQTIVHCKRNSKLISKNHQKNGYEKSIRLS